MSIFLREIIQQVLDIYFVDIYCKTETGKTVGIKPVF